MSLTRAQRERVEMPAPPSVYDPSQSKIQRIVRFDRRARACLKDITQLESKVKDAIHHHKYKQLTLFVEVTA